MVMIEKWMEKLGIMRIVKSKQKASPIVRLVLLPSFFACFRGISGNARDCEAWKVPLRRGGDLGGDLDPGMGDFVD